MTYIYRRLIDESMTTSKEYNIFFKNMEKNQTEPCFWLELTAALGSEQIQARPDFSLQRTHERLAS